MYVISSRGACAGSDQCRYQLENTAYHSGLSRLAIMQPYVNITVTSSMQYISHDL